MSTLVSLRQIRYFVAVAETGSFSAGARRSNVSQPALYLQIKQLEKGMGRALLLPHSRGVELTASGKIFLSHATAALEELRRAERAMALLDFDNAKEISLGVMPTPGRALVVDLLCKSKEALGSPNLQFHEGLSDELWRLIADGELDATFCYDPAPMKIVKIVPLYQEDLFLVGSPQILKSAEDLDRTSLCKFPLVLHNRNHGMRKFIESAMAVDGTNLKVAFEIEKKNLKRELLIHQGCCSIVPYGLFLEEIRSGQLCARHIRPGLSRTVALLLHDRLSAQTREFLIYLIHSIVKKHIEEKELQWRAI